jgi:chaperonin cofactor prefoldin
MNADEVQKFFAARKKKLKAAQRTLKKQIGALEKDIQEYDRLRRELDALISKYCPDKSDGRPRMWKGQGGYDLVVLVEGMRKQTGCTIKNAIKQLHKIKCPPCDQHSVKSLVIRYQEAKKHWEPAIRQIRKIEAELDALNAAAKECGPAMTFDEVRDLVNPNRKKSASTADAGD